MRDVALMPANQTFVTFLFCFFKVTVIYFSGLDAAQGDFHVQDGWELLN